MCLFKYYWHFIAFQISHKNVAAMIWENLLVSFSKTIYLCVLNTYKKYN